MSATAEIQVLPTVVLRPPAGLINDKRKYGWDLLEDTPIEGEGSQELEFVEFLRDGEDYVKGDVMFERAVELGNRAGQQHAERLLAQQKSIPNELRKFHLVFPGTKWRDSGGHPGYLFVPCLNGSGYMWELSWYWLGDVWNSRFRLVRYNYK